MSVQISGQLTITTQPNNGNTECDGGDPDTNGDFITWLTVDFGGAAASSPGCEPITWSDNYSPSDWTDDCGPNGNAQTVDVQFIATDNCGNTAVSQIVTFNFEDTTEPFFVNIPEDDQSECTGVAPDTDPNFNAWLMNFGNALVDDDCDVVADLVITSNYDPNDWIQICGESYMIDVTFVVTDDCGNSAEETATYTLEDTEGPVINTMAIDEVVECDGYGNITELTTWLNNNGGAVANDDNCDGTQPVWTYTPDPLNTNFYDCGFAGDILVEFVATDACGNTSTTEATFLIIDTQPPIFTLPSDVTAECDGEDNPTEVTAWLSMNAGATAMDVCSDVTWTNDFNSNNWTPICGESKFQDVTFFVEDACGNISSVMAVFTIEDTTPPNPDDPPPPEAYDCVVEVIPPDEPTGFDACQGEIEPTFSRNTIDSFCVNQKTYENIWEFKDDCNNTADPVVQLVNINDTELPIFLNPDVDIPEDITLPSVDCTDEQYDWTGEFPWPLMDGAHLSDNCGIYIDPSTGLQVQTTHMPGDFFPQGTTEVIFTVMDSCMNSTTESFEVTVECLVCAGGYFWATCDEAHDDGIDNGIAPFCDVNDIDNFESCTPAFQGGIMGPPQPNPLCNGQGVPNNMSWFAWVAADESLEVIVTPFNCNFQGGVTGVQAGIYDECTGTCIAGQATCSGTTEIIEFSYTGFTIGNIYHIFVDGCAGAECDYRIDIIGGNAFELSEPLEIEVMYECDPTIQDPVLTFCPGTELDFLAIHDGSSIIDDGNQGPYDPDLDATFQWTIDPPVDGQSFFEINSEDNGTQFDPLIFDEPGEYEVCLILVDSFCDDTEEVACVEITVAPLPDEDYGEWRVCIEDFALGWTPPIFYDPNGDGYGWDEDNIIDEQGVYFFETEDDCGCTYMQSIIVEEVGSDFAEEVTLNLFTCQLPYQWIEDIVLEGDEFMQFEVIEEGSNVLDWDLEPCDTMVIVTVNPIEPEGVLMPGPCSPDGTLYSFALTVPDDPSLVIYEWENTTTGNVVAEGDSLMINEALQGEYMINVTFEFIDAGFGDYNQCTVPFGPFTLTTGSSPPPVFNDLQTVYCDYDLADLFFTVDTVSETTFTWTVPAGVVATTSVIGDTLFGDFTNYTAGDSVFVTATNECGESLPEGFILTLIPPPVPSINADPAICVSDVLTLNFGGDQGAISSYQWTSPNIINGNVNGPGPIDLSFPDPGEYSYELIVTDTSGCVSDPLVQSVTVEGQILPPDVLCFPETNQILFQWSNVPGNEGYTVNVTDAPAGASSSMPSDTSILITGLSELETVEIEIFTLSTALCGNSVPASFQCQAGNCLPAQFGLNVFRDTSFCLNDPATAVFNFDVSSPPNPISAQYTGTGIMDAAIGTFDPFTASLGPNTVTYEYIDSVGCYSEVSITVDIYAEPVTDFTVSADAICLGETVEINYTGDVVATWDYGVNGSQLPDGSISWTSSGVKMIDLSVTTLDGCTKDTVAMVEVMDTLIFDGINCVGQDVDFVEFDWADVAGVSGYEILVDGNLVGTQNNSDFMISGLSPGQVVEITVTAISTNMCPDVTRILECIAVSCTAADISFTVDPAYCYAQGDPPIALGVEAVSNMGGAGLGEWLTPDVDFDGNFTPPGQNDTTYTLVYSFTEGDCVTFDSVTFDVIQIPETLLQLDGPETICVTGSTTVSSGFNAQNGETPEWDFGNANLVTATGTGFGPYELEFTQPGNYDVALYVDNEGCTSPTEIVSITVEPVLTPPVISCNTDISSINFDWSNVTGVSGYEVIIDGNSVSIQDSSSFFVGNLSPGQVVEIQVAAMSATSCPDVTSTLECVAINCTAADISFTVDPSYCYATGDPPIALGVTAVSNMGGTGIGEWLSEDVDFDGNFTPPGQNDATYTLLYSFTEGDCVTFDSVTFDVIQTPETLLQLNGPETICVTGSTTVSSGFNAQNGEVPQWDFGNTGLVTATGTGFGPYELTFAQPGNYDVALYVDNEGCTSPTEVVTITVEPELIEPVISCSPDLSSITFNWNNVDCADMYVVTVDGVVANIQPETSYTVTGLAEGQQVEFIIEANSECACPNVIAELSCTATSCPQATFSVGNYPSEVCLDGSENDIQFAITVNGTQGGGNAIWSGPGISASGLFDIDTQGPGTYDFLFNYAEGDCPYDTTISITLLEAPAIDVATEDPDCYLENTGNISINASDGQPGYSFELSNGLTNATGMFTSIAPGSYTMTVTDSNGCTITGNAAIVAAPQPSVEIEGPNLVILNDSGLYNYQLSQSLPVEDIVWTANGEVVCTGTACNTLDLTVLGDTELCVEIYYNDGCVITDCFQVRSREIRNFYIPNIFSPNDDGINDDWIMFIKASDIIINSARVYDRWGELVHVADVPGTVVDELLLWDGKFNEKDVVPGVYVYIIDMNIGSSQEFETGDVTVVR